MNWSFDEIALTAEAHLRIQRGEARAQVIGDCEKIWAGRRDREAIDAAVRAVKGGGMTLAPYAKPIIDSLLADPKLLKRVCDRTRELWAK